ncbi:MAG: 23S rRNA (pseudouridine(1915)-N(3))-methyltransferase RlmH [Lachnospiraceae bacterium]|nr:23S rRNA (pseudouridine(1915)-N(3))-methyltransferase RlmH [Lachnospiraceae bacterium]
MKITIVCVGKVKEKFYRDAIAEFEKRLGRYCRLEIIEVADEQTPDGMPVSMEILIKEREGSRILSKIKPDAYVCTLEIGGKKMTSEGFSKFMEQAAITGKGHIIFVIGGSLGLSEAVMKRSNQAISFSDMTFPHQLMRVILCEQIYRGFRISHGEPYHK